MPEAVISMKDYYLFWGELSRWDASINYKRLKWFVKQHKVHKTK
jgi:hypothetical protein